MEIGNVEVGDLEEITAIYNDAVANTTAIWNDTEVTVENRHAWMLERAERGYPILVMREASGLVLGYASFGDWRAFDGYRHTVEHSVYVSRDQRGRGIGTLLMLELIERARGLGKHVMVAGIESGNQASIGLHERLGFARVGSMPQVGAKFGRWLDLTFLQLVLDDRPAP